MGGNGDSPIPEARLDDLDLDNEGDATIWRSRLAAMAESRLRQARVRLQEMGIIDVQGQIVSRELPPDMLPTSQTSVSTG